MTELEAEHDRLTAALERIAEICHMGLEGYDALEERDEIERIARAALTPPAPREETSHA